MENRRKYHFSRSQKSRRLRKLKKVLKKQVLILKQIKNDLTSI